MPIGAAPSFSSTTFLEEIMFRHRTRTLSTFVVLMAFTACTYHPSRFPMYGSTDHRTRLAGEWVGEFQGARSDRSGSIDFRLEADRDSASGEVSLLDSYMGYARPLRYDERGPAARVTTGTTLRIRYVRVGGSIVEGLLEPFRDPECDCMVTTRFLGEIRGDSIIGEYVSRDGWTTRRGEWRMSRR
jgi:hypothetical protein